MMLLFLLLIIVEVVVMPVVAPTGAWLITPLLLLYFGSRGQWRASLTTFAAVLVASWFVPIPWTLIGISILVSIGMFPLFRLWIDTSNRLMSTLATGTIVTILSFGASFVMAGDVSWLQALYACGSCVILWGLYYFPQGAAR